MSTINQYKDEIVLHTKGSFDSVINHCTHYIKGNKAIEAHRDSCFYIEDSFYILPTVAISCTGKYFEIIFHWLKFEYYEATSLEFEKDEE